MTMFAHGTGDHDENERDELMRFLTWSYHRALGVHDLLETVRRCCRKPEGAELADIVRCAADERGLNAEEAERWIPRVIDLAIYMGEVHCIGCRFHAPDEPESIVALVRVPLSQWEEMRHRVVNGRAAWLSPP